MQNAVVGKVADALNVHRKPLNGSHILAMGIAYKRDIDDIRESPALDVMGLLHEKGARLSYIDPHVPALAGSAWPGGYDLRSVSADTLSDRAIDCVAILTDHRAFDYEALVAAASLVVDTRNAIKQPHPHVFRLGAPNRGDASVQTSDELVGGRA